MTLKQMKALTKFGEKCIEVLKADCGYVAGESNMIALQAMLLSHLIAQYPKEDCLVLNDWAIQCASNLEQMEEGDFFTKVNESDNQLKEMMPFLNVFLNKMLDSKDYYYKDNDWLDAFYHFNKYRNLTRE